MEFTIDPNELNIARKLLTYQEELPESLKCSECHNNSRLIMLIDDSQGELANLKIKRVDGIPIHPHDSCIFALYMCTQCGHVDVEWNQDKLMSNECRYHAVGDSVYYKGDKKVRCYGSESESESMAKDIAEHLNEWLKTLEWLDSLEKGVK